MCKEHERFSLTIKHAPQSNPLFIQGNGPSILVLGIEKPLEMHFLEKSDFDVSLTCDKQTDKQTNFFHMTLLTVEGIF